MAINHLDGTMFTSVVICPMAATVGAGSAGAGWWTIFFIPIGLGVGCAVAYAGRKLIYGICEFVMKPTSKAPKGRVHRFFLSLFLLVFYMVLPSVIVGIGALDTWYGSIWLVRHTM